jgi:hypothetical protein
VPSARAAGLASAECGSGIHSTLATGIQSRATIEAREQHLHDLLDALGNGQITVDSFWTLMHADRLTDADIDAYCRKHGGWISSSDYSKCGGLW